MTTHTRQIPLDVSGDPVGKLCRAMVGEGLTGSLSLLSTSNGKPLLRVGDIEGRAKLTVREDDKRGPHWVAWKPYPEGVHRPVPSTKQD